MPELPEVQTTVNGLNTYAKGLTITDVWTDYASIKYAGKDQIKNSVYFKRFKKEVTGAKIIKAERRAKNILIELSTGKTILIHMKMTGHILYGKYSQLKTSNLKLKTRKGNWVATEPGALRDDPFNRFIHFVLSLSNGNHLALSDMRKFAKVSLLPTDSLFESSDLAGIGPEPLNDVFTEKILIERLAIKPNGQIKTVLMNQCVLAGIGNIYSDEILWASSVHPLSVVSNLKPAQVKLMWKQIKIILVKGINFGGDSMSDYRNLDGKPGEFQMNHEAYRRTGKLCRRKGCSGTIHRLKIGGRSAHFCSRHQILIK